MQKCAKFIEYLIESDTQPYGLKYLFTSLYNLAVVLFNSKQMREVFTEIKDVMALQISFPFFFVSAMLFLDINFAPLLSHSTFVISSITTFQVKVEKKTL